MITQPVAQQKIEKKPKRHLQLLTASRMKEFRACNRRHYYAYVLQIRPVKPAEALVMGTWFHKAVERYWRSRLAGMDLVACGYAAMAEMEAIKQSEGDTLDRQAFSRTRVMVAAYVSVWNTRTDVEPIAVEVSFRIPLVSPTGQVSTFWELSGKMDLLAKFSGVVKVTEHKTSASDIDVGSDYRRKLTLDEQISLYLKATREMGIPADGIVYDVTRKSRKRPLLATPEADREYTKGKTRKCKQCAALTKKSKKASEITIDPPPHLDEETGTFCVDGNVIVEEPRLYSAQRDRDETPEEFESRVAEDGLSSMVEIVDVARFEKEMEAFDANILMQAKVMRFAIENNLHPQNSDACFQFHGSPCAYLEVCRGNADINNPYLFKKLDTAHPELEDDNVVKEIS